MGGVELFLKLKLSIVRALSSDTSLELAASIPILPLYYFQKTYKNLRTERQALRSIHTSFAQSTVINPFIQALRKISMFLRIRRFEGQQMYPSTSLTAHFPSAHSHRDIPRVVSAILCNSSLWIPLAKLIPKRLHLHSIHLSFILRL